MAIWIKALGTAQDPLPDEWQKKSRGVLVSHATFAKKPMVQAGDRIVYYAAGVKVFFAAGDVTSQPYQNPTDGEGWDWRVDVRLSESKRYLHEAPRIEALRLPTARNDICVRLKRRSHVQLSPEEYDAAVSLLR